MFVLRGLGCEMTVMFYRLQLMKVLSLFDFLALRFLYLDLIICVTQVLLFTTAHHENFERVVLTGKAGIMT